VLLIESIGETVILPSVTAVLLHHSAMDIWTTVVLLAQAKGEISFLPSVTAVLLNPSFSNVLVVYITRSFSVFVMFHL